MAAFIRKDNFKVAAQLGVMDCVSCGSCSWLCPSHIPLVHYFNYAKGMINDQERERRKIEQTRILAEAHTLRVEKAAADKAAALAAKKAQAAAAAAAKEKDETPA
jgi:electron transport complex protein RnfC